MSKYNKQFANQQSTVSDNPRYKRILAMPPDTAMYCMDDERREVYHVSQFRIPDEYEYSSKIDEFAVDQPVCNQKDRVYVPFLRLWDDGTRCSLMKKGNDDDDYQTATFRNQSSIYGANRR